MPVFNRSRRQLLDELAAGTTLVVDRYAYSGAAFTAAKGVPTLDLPWCKVGSRPPCSVTPAPLSRDTQSLGWKPQRGVCHLRPDVAAAAAVAAAEFQ